MKQEFNPYSAKEIEEINKMTEKNEQMEEYFKDKREGWNKNVEPLFTILSIDLSNPANSKDVLNAQANALTFRQNLNDQIGYFLNRRSRETSKLKTLKQDKFLYYAVGFPIKTNMGEKNILIDAHLRESDRTIELIDAYIEFLRDTVKNLESLQYSIKNMIELMNYLGR